MADIIIHHVPCNDHYQVRDMPYCGIMRVRQADFNNVEQVSPKVENIPQGEYFDQNTLILNLVWKDYVPEANNVCGIHLILNICNVILCGHFSSFGEAKRP